MIDSPAHESKDIREYVEIEAREEVVSLEKVKTEGVFGEQYDVWDVRTLGQKPHRWGRRRPNRWWVITNITNLYSFDSYPSLDHLLSFHIGLMHRVTENQRKQPKEEPMPKFREAWRRFGQAFDRYNLAKEAEDFQAVGNHLRECLLALARDHADPALVGENEPTPKLGDFKGWSALLARDISDGRLRDYLKQVATSTWDVVQGLVHDRNSHLYDAEIALDAASHLLGVFGVAVVAHERGDPPRCPSCGSYQLASDWRSAEGLYYTVCGACGWEALDEELNSRPKPTAQQVEASLNREVEGP